MGTQKGKRYRAYTHKTFHKFLMDILEDQKEHRSENLFGELVTNNFPELMKDAYISKITNEF